jgi:hypothetical protein
MMEEVMPSYQSKIQSFFPFLVFFLYLISVGVQELWQYLTIVSLSTLKRYVDGVVVSYIVQMHQIIKRLPLSLRVKDIQ